MKARLLMLFVALTLAASASGAKLWTRTLTEQELDQLIDSSPVVKPVGKAHFDAQPAGTTIEVYYTRWSILHLAHDPDAPNASHFIMGKPGDPTWKYVEIAQIAIYRTMRADPIVIAAMKKQAAAMGGNALRDCHREPILLEDSAMRAPDNWQQTLIEVAGYKFFCSIVRRKE